MRYCSAPFAKLAYSCSAFRRRISNNSSVYQILRKSLDAPESKYAHVFKICQLDSHISKRNYSVWDKKIKDIRTVLHSAVVDDLGKFKHFIEHTPTELFATEDKFGATVLHLSVLNGSKNIFDYILSDKRLYQLLINKPDNHGMTPLHIACTMTNHQFYHALMEKGADPLLKDNDGNNVLHVAASYGAFDIIKDLINKYNVPLEYTGENGGTALHFAARQGKLAIVEFLVKAGAKVDALSADDSTPLHLAAYGVKKNVSIFLMDRGANVNARNENGWTPLHAAAAGDAGGVYETAIIEYMIEKGAVINAIDNKGQTPRDIVETKALKLLLSDKVPDWHSKKWHLWREKFTEWWSRKPSS